MSTSPLAQSIRHKLLNRARQQGEDLQLLMTRYANERVLYRLSQSPYREEFVLKGAMLFTIWSPTPHRATRDIDLLGTGLVTEDSLKTVFSELLALPVEDGLSFDVGTLLVKPIREDQIHGGLRATFTARLGSARLPLQVDVGLGDIHGKAAVVVPSLLDQPPAQLLAYDRETVIAEKLEATVTLGTTNSRMKDFYDIATLSQEFSFDGRALVQAIRGTFGQRGTPLPSRPLAELLHDLAAEPSKPLQWKAFVRKATPHHEWGFEKTLELVAAFAGELLQKARRDAPFDRVWRPGGPWSEVNRE